MSDLLLWHLLFGTTLWLAAGSGNAWQQGTGSRRQATAAEATSVEGGALIAGPTIPNNQNLTSPGT